MRHFRATREGWLRATPSDETLAWARRLEAEGDGRKPNDMRNFSARRWQGFVAERAVDVWLGLEQVEHVWNGDTDARPDFEIGALTVGVKCCGSRRPWRAGLVVNVYERHREHPWDELLFVGYEHPAPPARERATVVLLGGLSAADYFEQAVFIERGTPLNPSVIAENDVWNLRTGLLEPPAAWLARITGSG